MTANPGFTIVIPTFQRREVVCDAIRALGNLEYGGDVEVVVAIDGSTDGTAEALSQLQCPFPLRILNLAHGGAAYARNCGAAQATGDIILFIDDDMICEPDLVQQHANMYRDGADAVTGEVFLDPGSPQTFITESVARWISLQRPPEVVLPFHVYTGQLSVRRSVFNEIGGFDGGFTSGPAFGHEDTDFGAKLLTRYDFRHNRHAISWQRYVVGPVETMKRASRTAAADLRFVSRYPQFARHLFEQRGYSRWKTRLLFWPISRIPFVPQIMARLAVSAAEAGLKTRFRSHPVLRTFFFAARAVNYWAALRTMGGIPSSQSLLILCYHSITDQSDDAVLGPYGVPRKQFTAQLQSLSRRGFLFIGPDALAAFLRERVCVPRRAVLLTFDDCYDDLLEVARDVLQPHGIQAIAFAVTGMQSGTNEWDQPHGAEPVRLLRPDELGELSALGVEIGAHSRTHRRMPVLEPEERDKEARGAFEDFASRGLPRPRFFAYPYGASDEASMRAVREAGYMAAFGIRHRHASHSSDPFCLPRVPVLASDVGWRFRLKTSFPGVFEWVDLNLRRASKVLRRAASIRLA